MKFKIAFEMDNAAFGESYAFEVDRILNRVMEQVREGSDGNAVMDCNGNKVGSWEVV